MGWMGRHFTKSEEMLACPMPPQAEMKVSKVGIARTYVNGIMFPLEVQVDYFLNGFSVKTIVLVRVYYPKNLGNVILMVFDFQGFCLSKKWFHTSKRSYKVNSLTCSFFLPKTTKPVWPSHHYTLVN